MSLIKPSTCTGVRPNVTQCDAFEPNANHYLMPNIANTIHMVSLLLSNDYVAMEACCPKYTTLLSLAESTTRK